jgi:predicted ATPase
MGQAHFYSGDFDAARPHFENGLAVYDPERDRAMAALNGYDIGATCHMWLAHVLYCRGSPDEALRHATEAIAAARAAAHPQSEVVALAVAALIHQLRGEEALCLERVEAALALSTEQILPFAATYAIGPSGWALVKRGEAEEGLARLRAGIDAHRASGARLRTPDRLALLAAACLAAGRIEEGLSAVRDALTETDETKVRWYDAELNRLEGELLLASEDPDESRAEASFRKALGIAGGQKAKSWELRAATSLAKLLARQGKHEEAHALLAPIHDWFTEGFDTADLKAAKALLDDLDQKRD